MILVIEYSEQLKSYLNKYDIESFDYSQFQNIKTIGKGAYATVYSATFKEKVYALKSLDNNLGLDEREFNQLQREELDKLLVEPTIEFVTNNINQLIIQPELYPNEDDDLNEYGYCIECENTID
ncbi:12656_t:CDS:2, partial [Cetraspora pellucida]